MRSIYSARNGISAQQQRIDTIAANMSNVSTTGYKSSRVDFKDCLYQTLRRPVSPQDDLNLRMGNGTIVGATTKNMSSGQLLNSNISTDLGIEGDGFFAINQGGNIYYTKAGNFSVDSSGNLVNSNGAFVLDQNLNPVVVGTSEFDCDVNGQIFVDGQLVATVGVFDCANASGLSKVGNTNFETTQASGEMVANNNSLVRQGFYEGSNVDIAKETTNLIRAQRALSMASRALTTADEMEAKAISIRQ